MLSELFAMLINVRAGRRCMYYVVCSTGDDELSAAGRSLMSHISDW